MAFRQDGVRQYPFEAIAGKGVEVATEGRQQANVANRADLSGLVRCYPSEIITALRQVAERQSTRIYLVGGTVRDWLLGRSPRDLDLTVAAGAESLCRDLIRVLGGGAFVRLGTEREEAARVVWQGQVVDVSAFRGQAATIGEDLALRDFSINSMAIELGPCLTGEMQPELIDPLGGFGDLQRGRLRHCPRAFADDPLRLVRAYRFMATLGFSLEEATSQAIRRNAQAIRQVAAERVNYELDLIVQAPRSAAVLWQMHESGLLGVILPELYAGRGVVQPEFHHLDVFDHGFQALRELEDLLALEHLPFPRQAGEMRPYLADSRIRVCLKWAALFHDIGKPAAKGQEQEHEEGRVTFHGHDEIGSRLFTALARRLKWSNNERERTAHLIAMHMHPFHLCNVQREQQVSVRAALKLCRRAGDDLPGLFLLAMADSLASSGALKPENMELELVELYDSVMAMHQEHIRPVLTGPPLLTGRDLIDQCRLRPGPIFSTILDELLVLQVEGAITTRDEAIQWVEHFLRQEEHEQGRR